MTPKEKRLMVALCRADDAISRVWPQIVEATNDLATGIEAGEDFYSSSFPPELLRAMDDMALKTAWIYHRVESASDGRLNTYGKIRRALGYNTERRRG